MRMEKIHSLEAANRDLRLEIERRQERDLHAIAWLGPGPRPYGAPPEPIHLIPRGLWIAQRQEFLDAGQAQRAQVMQGEAPSLPGNQDGSRMQSMQAQGQSMQGPGRNG